MHSAEHYASLEAGPNSRIRATKAATLDQDQIDYRASLAARVALSISRGAPAWESLKELHRAEDLPAPDELMAQLEQLRVFDESTPTVVHCPYWPDIAFPMVLARVDAKCRSDFRAPFEAGVVWGIRPLRKGNPNQPFQARQGERAVQIIVLTRRLLRAGGDPERMLRRARSGLRPGDALLIFVSDDFESVVPAKTDLVLGSDQRGE